MAPVAEAILVTGHCAPLFVNRRHYVTLDFQRIFHVSEQRIVSAGTGANRATGLSCFEMVIGSRVFSTRSMSLRHSALNRAAEMSVATAPATTECGHDTKLFILAVNKDGTASSRYPKRRNPPPQIQQ
jgi:hypothetical protein